MKFLMLICTLVMLAGGCSKDDFANEAKVSGQVRVPTAFSPDNDGVNDVFLVDAREVVFFHLRTYNPANSLLVFESNDINQGWDGRVNGVNAPAGNYYYILVIEQENTSREQLSGSLALVR